MKYEAEQLPTLVQAYLDQQLPPAEREALEKAMAEDPKLAEEVKYYQELLLGLGGLELTHFQTKLGSWEAKQRKSRPGRLWSGPALIAASIALMLLIGAYVWWQSQDQPDAPALFASYFTPYENVLTQRDPQGDSLLQLGLDAYDAQQYERAQSLLETYFAAAPQRKGEQLYLGICYLINKQYPPALIRFEQARQDPLYREQARWYEALTLLRMGKRDAAKTTLIRITQVEGPHFQQAAARQLLTALDS